MRREKIAAFPMAFAMSLALAIGSIGAIVTGIPLSVENMEQLYMAFGVTAWIGCILFLFKKGWIAAVLLATAGFAYLWQAHYLSLPIRALIARLSWIYDSAYGWGAVEFVGVNWRETPLDLILGFWGCLTALSAARSMMQGRWLGLTLALTLLPVAATVVVTNTVPAPFFLYLTFLGVILLLLTSTVRRQNPAQGAALTAMTALPVALLLGLLFHLYPKDSYVNHSQEYLDKAVAFWENTVTFSFDNTGLISQPPATPNASATANLSRVGPRNTWGYTVFEAEADYSGVVYLRGQDFDSYDGVSWTALENRSETFGGLPDYGTWTYDGEITVRTAAAANVLYLPYYPTAAQPLEGGRMENPADLREYSFGVRHPTYADLYRIDAPTAELDSAQRYTALPSDTRRWAVWYLQEHFESSLLFASDNYIIAEAIAGHVRDLVPYDTNTPRMDGDSGDFVRWFLEEAETGYCVHFASAATVLLRAAGVPARYVTGYLFTAEAGETVEVTADQAHAWAEYYHEGLNAWIALEATPADLRQEETEPPETEPEETDPPTDAPTEAERETRPNAERPGDTEEKTGLTWLWTALRWLLLPIGLWLAAAIQYTLRRNLRKVGRKPNARALAYWADVEMLCRFTRQEPPEDLKFLAEKAKFSQHTLTAEELNTFRAWLTEERRKLKEKPWYVRFVYQYVLALW